MTSPVSSKPPPRIAPIKSGETAAQAAEPAAAGHKNAGELSKQVHAVPDQMVSGKPIPPEQQAIEEFSDANLPAAAQKSTAAHGASEAGEEITERLCKGIQKPVGAAQQGPGPGDGKTPPPLSWTMRWPP